MYRQNYWKMLNVLVSVLNGMTMSAFSFFVHILYFLKFLQWHTIFILGKKNMPFLKSKKDACKIYVTEEQSDEVTRGHRKARMCTLTHSLKITKPRKSKKKKERKLSMFCHSCGLERKSNYRKYLLSGYLFKKSPTLNLSWDGICVRWEHDLLHKKHFYFIIGNVTVVPSFWCIKVLST